MGTQLKARRSGVILSGPVVGVNPIEAAPRVERIVKVHGSQNDPGMRASEIVDTHFAAALTTLVDVTLAVDEDAACLFSLAK